MITSRVMARIVIDLAMTLALPLALGYRVTGGVAHEGAGIVLGALFVAHNVVNRRWWTRLATGRYTPRRVTLTVVNVLLALSMITLMITGLAGSREALAFLRLSGGGGLRRVHATAAYWGQVLAALHAGLHGNMIARFFEKSRVRAMLGRALAALIAAFGAWAFVDRDMFYKLFLGYSFDYWDSKRPVVFFFVETLGVMALCGIMTYYALRLIESKRTNTQGGLR